MEELHHYTGCPLCDATNMREIGVADCSRHPMYKPEISPRIHWISCERCGHVFRNGYYTDEAAAIVFSSTNEHQAVGHQYEKQRAISARMIEKVLPFKFEGPWLDVGFGNGALLLTAHEYGFEPVGTDLRSGNVEAIAKLGIEAYCTDLASFGQSARFSVISMADVLEHMPFPIEGLRLAYDLLEDGGVLFLSMPNSESMLWRLLNAQGANPYWGELEHYHNFSRTRLYALLEKTGFSPARYGISERYRACMEVIATKQSSTPS